jgi:acetolactate synthase-1/2/3 large subunit
VPGESFLGLLEALPEAGVRLVATRHEGGAAFMAEAVGQLTNRPAAVLATRAVGAGNMAIGIHTARADSTPLVALIGQVERHNRGREAFQESELTTTPGALAKWATEIDEPAAAAGRLAEGLRAMAAGRPGPVLFAVPEDVLDQPAGDDRVDVHVAPPPAPEPAAVEAVLRLLAGADRPLMLVGGGVKAAAAGPALVRFAEATGVPVMCAWRRPDAFPNDHPLYLGVTGYGSAATVRPRLAQADALLVLGCRLNQVASFDYAVPAPTTRWAHVDLAPRTAHARLPAPNLSLTADAAAFLQLALGLLGDQRGEPSAQVVADRQAYLAASAVDDGHPWAGPGVAPGKVINTLQRVLPADAVLATDAGNFGLWLARGYRFTLPNTFLGPTSGAMGYGLPAAIAASLCRPERIVVGLCGDGGLAMTMNELETAVREGARPVVLVFDNRRYGTISMHQQRRGRPAVATELGPIDFAAVARACGALGLHVERDADFEPALRQALAAGRPALIHLELDQRWISPDTIGRSMASAP